MKNKIGILGLIFMLLMSSAQVADAAIKTDEKRGFVPMYNPNGGGLLASITLIVNTRIDYNPPSIPNPDYNSVQFFVQTSTLNSSYIQCGGTMTTVTPAKMGSTNIALSPDTSSFIGDSKFSYSRYKSTNEGRAKGSYTVQTSGQFYPTPSSCSGGGRVTSNFTFSNN